MPAWNYIGGQIGNDSSNAGFTLNSWTGTLQDGDLLIAVLNARNGEDLSAGLPLGGTDWTYIGKTPTASNNTAGGTGALSQLFLFYCIRSGGVDPSRVLTRNTGADLVNYNFHVVRAASGYRIEFVRASFESDASAVAATHTHASITSDHADSLIIHYMGYGASNGASDFAAATEPTIGSGSGSNGPSNIATGNMTPDEWQRRGNQGTTSGLDGGLSCAIAVKVNAGASGQLSSAISAGATRRVASAAAIFRQVGPASLAVTEADDTLSATGTGVPNRNNAWYKPLASLSTKTFSGTTPLAGLSAGLSTWANTGIPIYVATGSDPLVNVLYRDNFGDLYAGTYTHTGNTGPQETTIVGGASNTFPTAYNPYSTQVASNDGSLLSITSPYDPLTNPGSPPKQIRCPAGVSPTVSADGHLVVKQPDGTIFESFATIVLSDGRIVASRYKITEPRLGGDGWQNGVRASMVPTYFGVITDAEIAAGVIGHAIAIVAPPGKLDTKFTHPAIAIDRNALSNSPPYSGALPMGARLAIPASVNLATLMGTMQSVPWYPAGGVIPIIAQAMQDYGIIIVDRGGSGISLIDQQSGSSTAYDWAINDDIETLIDLLEVVTTNKFEFFRSLDGIEGAVAATEANDTVTATGALRIAGTLAATEANDTLAAAGGGSGISGSLSATEANDTVAATGALRVAGTLAATEANDTAAATGALRIAGTLAATEADDTLAGTGKVYISGSVGATEANDTSSATGKVYIVGTLGATEADDSLAASGAGLSNGTGIVNATEANDTLAATGALRISGTLAATEANDTVAATGALRIAGTAAVTEADDTAAATGKLAISGALAGTEANDTLAATALTSRLASLAATEANDILAAAGLLLIKGGLAAAEENDTAVSTGFMGTRRSPTGGRPAAGAGSRPPSSQSAGRPAALSRGRR